MPEFGACVAGVVDSIARCVKHGPGEGFREKGISHGACL